MIYAVFYRIFINLFTFYPIWLPLLLGILFFTMWLAYRRARYLVAQGSAFLEILLPREITKSPAAMEVVLTSLYQGAASSYAETFVDGKVRPWFSLELVSIEGKIHFYIWTHKKFKNIIEAQIYAQYPGVEVREAQDYTLDFTYDPALHGLWGTNFVLSKGNAVPMKTYVDYGLDKDPDEELKIDPMTSTLEYLGSMGPGEQAWIQLIIQAHKKTGLKEGMPHFGTFSAKVKKFFEDPSLKTFRDIYHLENEDWKSEIKKEISKIRDGLKGKEDKAERRPTRGETDTITAIERRSAKFPFEAMMRGFYIAKKENFNAIGITGLIGSVRQYAIAGPGDLNSFKLGWFTDHVDNPKDFFNFFFKKTGQKIRRKKERELLAAFKMRSYFQDPYKHFKNEPYILTTEEIATIFHFPGSVAATPGFSRIQSKKGEAPADLPV